MLIGFYLLNSKKNSVIIDWIFAAPIQLFSGINFFKFLKKTLYRLKEEEIFLHVFNPIFSILSQKKFQDFFYCEDSYLVLLLKTMKFLIIKIKSNLLDEWIPSLYDILMKDYLFHQDISISICQNAKTRSKGLSILGEIIKKDSNLALASLSVKYYIDYMGLDFNFSSYGILEL